MTDEELIKAYDADMAFRNLSESTRSVRRRYLAKYAREVGFQTATEQKVVQWLSRDTLQPKSRAMWISTLNSLYDWINHNHLFAGTEVGDPYNPISDIGKPRLHARSPRPMPKNDIQRAIAMADPKMRAWITLGALGGLRCMEIAGLCREDVREESMTMRIIGKGSKERFLPLHPDVLAALNNFGMPPEGRLWPDDAAAVSRKINRFLHGSVGTVCTAHTLRHAFLTAVYQSCHDLRLTQELAGHSSPQTTAGYAAADQSQASGIVSGLSLD